MPKTHEVEAHRQAKLAVDAAEALIVVYQRLLRSGIGPLALMVAAGQLWSYSARQLGCLRVLPGGEGLRDVVAFGGEPVAQLTADVVELDAQTRTLATGVSLSALARTIEAGRKGH